MKTALIIGANRGIGLQWVKKLLDNNYKVFATYRNAHDHLLAIKDNNLQLIKVDINVDKDVSHLKDKLKGIGIDLLIINSGILSDNPLTREQMRRLLETNTISCMLLAQNLKDNLLIGDDKILVTTSSSAGSMTENRGGVFPAYSMSKAALNAGMHSFAIHNPKIKVLIVHPGWVKTDMGGVDAAEITVETSVNGLFKIVSNADKYPSGSFLRYDGSKVSW